MAKERYYLLLGRYIAATTEVETRVDQVIGAFFNSDGPLWSEFNNWILGRIQFAQKREILAQIVEFLDAKDDADAKVLLKGLERMSGIRNDLAHGHYREVIEIGDGELRERGLGRMHRKAEHHAPDQFHLKMLNLDELQAELEKLDALHPPLADLCHRAFAIWPTVSVKDGVEVRNAGTLKDLEEKQRARRVERTRLK